jgi:hypothetical protein
MQAGKLTLRQAKFNHEFALSLPGHEFSLN